MAEVDFTVGTLPPPACGYATEQERFDAYVSALEGTVGDTEWQASIEQPTDLTLHWLKYDADDRAIAVLRYSEADARYVRWRMVPATDGTVGGTPDAITLTFDPTFSSSTAYQTGRQYVFEALADNTGAVTINVDGVGAVAVTKYGSTVLEAGDIQAGQLVVVMFDGASAQLLNPRVVPPEPQFLTFVSALEVIPASASTVTIPHGFLDGATNIMPHTVEVRLVRVSGGADTINYEGGGSFSIQENQELDHTMFWYGLGGAENEYFGPVFKVWCDDVNVYVSAYYPNGIAIPNYNAPLGNGAVMTQQITASEYQLKVYATALNPNF